MAKRKKRGKKKRKKQQLPPQLSWMDKAGLHAVLPGERPSGEMLAVFNENFRKELRLSPLWDELVEKFGEEEAEKLLQQVKIEVRG